LDSSGVAPQKHLFHEFSWRAGFVQRIIEDCAMANLPKRETMTEIKVGDRVYIRGLVHSDCLGLTGRVLEVRQSALFPTGVHRCKVDFNGKVRRLLSLHLTHAANRNTATTAA
jgi:hypothetical protein